MKLKDKIKSYSFWVSLASAIILILKILGNRFGFVVDETMVSDLFTALCSVLVLLGIIVVPSQTQATNLKKEHTSNIQPSQDFGSSLIIENNSNQEFEIKNNIELQNNEQIKEKEIAIENLNNISSNPIETQEIIFNKQEDCVIATQNDDSINIATSECKVESLLNEETTQSQNINEENTVNETENISTLKAILEQEKQKYAGNIDAYIFELQEAIRKSREGV